MQTIKQYLLGLSIR